ncbi:hypothetical protein GCM10011617_01810 [Novosphingobium arvoryzae]|uniref:Uncharacterized protein n=1 Tax=Novosphingobium arvoryzae TaxID=1256514 RepID=A0A918R5F9_9SPHN|nr:hypothetical protein GCM10011617_01810 [Novosphingobium arvoryzae]
MHPWDRPERKGAPGLSGALCQARPPLTSRRLAGAGMAGGAGRNVTPLRPNPVEWAIWRNPFAMLQIIGY